MKQKICHDDSTPPFSNFCSYCSRSKGCDSEDFIEVPDGSPDTIHIDEIFSQDLISDKIKSVAILFAEWLANERWYRNGETDEWYQIPRQNENKTSSELFSLYIDSLKNNSNG